MDISFFKALRRGCASLLLGASLMGLAGCATTTQKEYATPFEFRRQQEEFKEIERKSGYVFLDKNGEEELIMKSNDVYLHKIDGTGLRQITHTPERREQGACFSKDGNFIIIQEVYDTYKSGEYPLKSFLIRRDSDDSNRREITMDEATAIILGN